LRQHLLPSSPRRSSPCQTRLAPLLRAPEQPARPAFRWPCQALEPIRPLPLSARLALERLTRRVSQAHQAQRLTAVNRPVSASRSQLHTSARVLQLVWSETSESLASCFLACCRCQPRAMQVQWHPGRCGKGAKGRRAPAAWLGRCKAHRPAEGVGEEDCCGDHGG